MPIAAANLKFYRSANVSDADANGGRMSASEIVSGAAKNVFPAVGESERTAGSLKYRKVFCKNANADGLTLQDGKVYLDQYTLGDDIVTFFAASQVDTQDDITGSEKQYGCGKLDANVSAAATVVTVLVEDGAAQPFEDGDEIRITNKANVEAAGQEEIVTIVGAPVVAGDVVTITFTPALANGYSASASRVMNVYRPTPADVVARASDQSEMMVTSAAGTFDADNLLADNIGSVQQDWTLTFTSGTTFNAVGDALGAQGSGSIGAGAAPDNADFGEPYFTMQAAGFGGTWLAGDTIEFTTYPSAVPVWMRREVPAGSAASTTNKCVIVLDGETSDA